jgi:hypothetical protein
VSSGRIVPYDYEQADYWSPRIQGGIIPGWMKRLWQGKRDFWNEWNFDEAAEQSSPACFSQPSWGDDRYSGTSMEGVGTGSTTEFSRSWEMPNLPASGKEGVSVRATKDTMHHLPSRSAHLDSVQELD